MTVSCQKATSLEKGRQLRRPARKFNPFEKLALVLVKHQRYPHSSTRAKLSPEAGPGDDRHGSFASILRVSQTVVVSDVTRRSEYPDPKLEAKLVGLTTFAVAGLFMGCGRLGRGRLGRGRLAISRRQ
jgi:hypothetical protein